MSTVIAGATMSVDGFIAGPEETGFEHLFAWYEGGDIPFETTHPEIPFRMTAEDTAHVRAMLDDAGVFIVGRRLFDLTNGWGGIHPWDKPVVVVTHRVPQEWIAAHPDAPFTFVTGGVKEAVAVGHEIAGERSVVVNGGTMARQCLEAGLLDELHVDIAPVLLGAGVPLLGPFTGGPILLDDPEITPGHRVTHLRFRIR
ncbi:dihydrofolate reductase family protein [Nocardia jejuensis]|uniref:dihydrofolate reductase family protein n=1 Tax=Nocardia jejuensis TaxID=328049 RepID=UPI00082AAFDA|nr:dihydrofolate reductase family protein [Nocardia jejuensis]